MRNLIAALALLALPATSGEPIRVYLDGELIGTMAETEYRLAEGELRVTTFEDVFGCEQSLVFRDRFEL